MGKATPVIRALKDSGDSLGHHLRDLPGLTTRHHQKLDADIQLRRDTDNALGGLPAPRVPKSDMPSGPDTAVRKIDLKYKKGWTEDQRRQADEKVAALMALARDGKLIRPATTAERMKNLRQFYIDQTGISKEDLKNFDIDHILELQLGGDNSIANLWKLDRSVNRSFGAQIRHQLEQINVGDKIGEVTIRDR